MSNVPGGSRTFQDVLPRLIRLASLGLRGRCSVRRGYGIRPRQEPMQGHSEVQTKNDAGDKAPERPGIAAPGAVLDLHLIVEDHRSDLASLMPFHFHLMRVLDPHFMLRRQELDLVLGLAAGTGRKPLRVRAAL